MDAILGILRTNAQIVVFLALAIGYAAGRIKWRGFGLGSTTCVLLAAIALGQIGVTVPDLLKTISFALFTFCIGYKVGPQFFGALRKEGLNYVWLSLVVAFTGLAVALLLGKLFHFDAGTAAGFFAGSVTQSAALGTAEGAIRHLSLSDAQKQLLDTNVAVAYAITYIFGTAGGILFFKVAPGLLGFNLRDEARKLEERMSGGPALADGAGLFSWTKEVELRAYRVTNEAATGKTAAQIEALFSGRVAIDRIKRGDRVVEATPEVLLQPEDVVVVAGKQEWLLRAPELLGPEVGISQVVDIVGEVLEICVLNRDVVGKTLGEVAASGKVHGVFLKRITRQGHELPITRGTQIHKCDVVQLVGAKEDVERAAALVGYPERPTAVTDLVLVGIGCVLGTLLGLIAVPFFGIPLTLGVGGGVLVAGLVAGWLRAVHPTFGQIPSGGQWILQDLGLNLFVACVGLGAGPKAIQSLETTGLTVFLAGMILCLAPFVVGMLFGKIVLRMNPVLLLGALAGSRVLTAALNTLQEDAENATPLLGYAAPYAFGNVLLTIWGSVIVNVMS